MAEESEGRPACPRCGERHGPSERPGCAGPGAGATLLYGTASGEPAPGAPDPLIGSQVGSFKIVRMLGRGGMGTVYLGEHPAIGSRVAIKFLHEAMASDADLVRRFYDEARAVNLVGHENIVGVYDLSVLETGRYCFVMEYLEGETLAARQRRGRLPVADALDVLLQLCDALQCAHERGVVHRDLKPENVFLVTRRGKSTFVKLVDFGIAKLRGASGAGTTRAGHIFGTPEYMAPEQCDDRAVDARTDVYALGVIAFELATGRLPFTARAVTSLLLAHLREPPPPPSSLAPVDPELERIVLRALEKEPAHRFHDMAEMAEALRPVAERLGGGAQAEAPPAAASAPEPEGRRAQAETEPLEPELGVRLEAGGEARRLPVVELTRGGLFLRDEAPPPPLFSRVRLELTHRSFRAPLAVAAEVVRHVTPGEAATFRLAPGFAVQFLELAPEARAALAGLEALHREPAPRGAPPSALSVGLRLAGLEARAGAGPYALLGLAPDAGFPEIRRAGRVLRDELQRLAAHPLAPDHPGRAGALLARVQAAQAALGAPAPRLAQDGRSGNWRGVRRCLEAGVSEALREARRRELLAAEPARAAEARRQLALAQVARKLGNAAAAGAAWEAALAADPLDREALEGYVAWRRERESAAE